MARSPQQDQRQAGPGADRLICFICINYHCSELVKQLLASLDAQNDANSHCLIVDNSPWDQGLDDLEGRDDVTLLRSATNTGFGGGCNLALAYLELHQPHAVAWLINPDACLLPGALQTVRRCLQHNNPPSLLGTRIQDKQGKIWFSRGRFDPYWGKVYQDWPSIPDSACVAARAGLDPVSLDTLTDPCDWLSGCSLIIDLAAMVSPLRFDTAIFLYYEDAELCLRMAQTGLFSRVTKDVLVSHQVSATMTRHPIGRYMHAAFGKLYLLHRHATPLAVAINLSRFFVEAIFLLIMDPAQAAGKVAGASAYLAWLAKRQMVKLCMRSVDRSPVRL